MDNENPTGAMGFVQLPEHIIKQCVDLPEDGMGYQFLTVTLKDGTAFPNVLVSGSQAIYQGHPFDVNDIASVSRPEKEKAMKDKDRFDVQAERIASNKKTYMMTNQAWHDYLAKALRNEYGRGRKEVQDAIRNALDIPMNPD